MYAWIDLYMQKQKPQPFTIQTHKKCNCPFDHMVRQRMKQMIHFFDSIGKKN